MDGRGWQQIQDLFTRAADLPVDAQAAALEQMYDGESAEKDYVLREVRAMLEEDRCANPLLDASLGETARAVLEFGSLPSLVQREIGPYRLIKFLGEGGMGVVYLAERTNIGGEVAIKLLRDAWLSPMRRQRFRIEQQTLAQLNHPGIARIYDSNTLEDGTPWFVMEYAPGVPLTEYWSEHGTSVRDCLKLLRQVCEAVQYAHGQAIIHRDLKPSNILVSKTGEVKLLDFGIAKQLNAEEPDKRRTVTAMRMMTLAYAAPEQLSGGTVGVYTDVYALGVLLYELLTGRLPQRTAEGAPAAPADAIEQPSAVLRRERSQLFAQLSKAEWADLDVLTSKALEVSPERRYRTVDALMRDLDALLGGQPLEARPNTIGYTIGKFASRNRRSLAAAAAALVLTSATIVFYTVRLQHARNEALREAARTRAIQQFTERLFDGGDKSAGPAMDLKAVQLLDRGRLEAASLGNDPEMQADMQQTLGGIYQKLGKLDLADPLLVAALDERKRLQPGDSAKVAESLVDLGLLRKDEGKLDEAETLVRQGMEMSQRAFARANDNAVRMISLKAMVAMGAVLEVRAKYDQATPILEAALKQQPQDSDATAATAENLLELANVAFYKGQYDRAEALNNQALAIDERVLGGENPAVAQELNNLGAIEMNRGNYPASEAYYRRALALTQAWYGTDHPETAANMTALAQPLTFDKKEAEAQSLLEHALEIQKRVNGPVNATVATTQNQLGILAFQRKQFDVAQSYFTQARDTWQQLFGDGYPSVAVAYSNLGSVCLEKKDLACAEKMYREAVRRLDASSANSLNDTVAHIKLGRALLREGRFAEAEPETLLGYTRLVKTVSPTDHFLNIARNDLASIYDGLHDATKAARFRSELEAAQTAQK